MTHTILVVEDAPTSRQPMARVLRSQGYETLCAVNGEAAFEVMSFTRPNLILLDLMMPGMGGVEFLKLMRQDPRWAGLPVIVLTGKPPEDASVREARLLGAKDCLEKTAVTLDELCVSIRKHLAA